MKRWTNPAAGRNIFALITVIIVDDGVASGFTLVAAVE
jgi:predicted phosphoribosyltransferase